MKNAAGETNTGGVVANNIPFLRRYARALTGNQADGDKLAAETLQALLDSPPKKDSRLSLYSAFHEIWVSGGAPVSSRENGLKAQAQKHLAGLTPLSREALLLTSIEHFSVAQVAQIMALEKAAVEELITQARYDMLEAVAGTVLIIEDEPLVAMDLETIVTDMGHTVTGVARTHESATELGRKTPPDLILADIRLADESSGAEAVTDLLSAIGGRPVVFITAYPERLLTGEKPEPAFLIAKPFSEAQVVSAVGQAMFFASTETLRQNAQPN